MKRSQSEVNMDLVQTDYPEQYRIRYDINSHAFEILVPLETAQHLRQHIAEFEMTVPDDPIPSRIETDPFINESLRWGFGGCMKIVDTHPMPIGIFHCDLNPRQQNNITRTLVGLLEALNGLVYSQNESESSNKTQFATIQTALYADELHWNCSIGSSLSKRARRSIEQLASSPGDDRAFFFENVVLAMKDAFICLNTSTQTQHRQCLPLSAEPNGAIFDLLSVLLISSWRIRMDCIGASLVIDPRYDQAGENRGAQWVPHNVDSPDCQLTLLAGLCTCYQQLQG